VLKKSRQILILVAASATFQADGAPISTSIATCNPCRQIARPADARPWTVRTSLGLRYFGDMRIEYQNPALFLYMPVQPFLPSPNGKLFAVMTLRGDLEADQNVAEMRVYSTDSVWNSVSKGLPLPEPLRTVTRRSSSNASPIAGQRWADGGDAILFATVDPDIKTSQSGQLDHDERLVKLSYLDIGTGEVSDLVPPGFVSRSSDLLAWWGKSAIFFASRVTGKVPVSSPSTYPVSIVGSGNLFGLGGHKEEDLRDSPAMYLAHHGKIHAIEDGRGGRLGASGYSLASVSPAGNVAIVVAIMRQGPAWAGCPSNEERTSAIRCHTFMSVDLQGGTSEELVSAPTIDHLQIPRTTTQILWTPDGSTAILTNCLLPRAGDSSEPVGNSYVVSYEVSSKSLRPIVAMAGEGPLVLSVDWAIAGEVLRVRRSEGAPMYFRRTSDGWSALAKEPATVRTQNLAWTFPPRAATAEEEGRYPTPRTQVSNGLTLWLHEAPNDPQQLMVSDGQHKRVLVGVDRSLINVRLASSKVTTWTTSSGRVQRGLLTLPPGTRAHHPLPLVIQNYYFMPYVFRPDGPMPSAYAAQALAARGMAVLGIDLSDLSVNTGDGLLEGPLGVQTIDAAVDSLVRQGLIDPKRVGIIGFSRGGLVPFYAITHPGRIKLAAALSSDSYLASFGEYLMSGAVSFPLYAQSQFVTTTELVLTGKKTDGGFWANKEKWLSENPVFNIDKVATPYMYLGNGTSLDYFVIFSQLTGIFALNRRPLEILNLPLGTHPLVRPREREASLNASVDWMDFWLNEREDPAPEKLPQYLRWREMKAHWIQQAAWEASGHPPGSVPPTKADFPYGANR